MFRRVCAHGALPSTSIRRHGWIVLRPISYSMVCMRESTKKPPKSRSKLGIVATMKSPVYTPGGLEQKLLRQRLQTFATDHRIKNKAGRMGIRNDLFKSLAPQFTEAVLAGKISRCSTKMLMQAFREEGSIESVDRVLLSAFYEYAVPYLPDNIRESYNSLRKLSDLRFPGEWFPGARQMQRTIHLHVGPTNSGKTYRALKRLTEAESGIYCGPLRLLAHEVYDKMNTAGIACSLLTGEERRDIPNATLTSSTVEMANLAKPMEVAVIDEIQMIGDSNRGWAWTQALLGIKAKEIHLCGEPSVVPLIKKICESLNEKVVVNEYERLTPVTVADKCLQKNWNSVEKGDCVVAFSRQQIFAIKDKIEQSTGLRCAVAYGNLPPELRALQAKHFNDPENPLDVLVASDAVGMGLNLNIKRMIFSTVLKFDGSEMKYLPFPQLKQIAGRAGRFGTVYEKGEISAMSMRDLSFIKKAVGSPIQYLELAGLQPTVDILEVFAMQMPHESLSGLLQKFEELASLDGNYFLCNFHDQKVIADRLAPLNMHIRDRYQFINAPATTRRESSLNLIYDLAKIHSEGQTCTLANVVSLPDKSSATSRHLEALEISHKAIILYMWLSLRYPETYITHQEEALQYKQKCENLIDDILKARANEQSGKPRNGKRLFPMISSKQIKVRDSL